MTTFNLLPTELRLMIWDFALHFEAENRIIILCHPYPSTLPPHVVPLQHHASPFLSVNRESRYIATKFYTIVLKVYQTPQILISTDTHYVGAIRKAANNISRAGKFKGVIYLSPEWDMFANGYGIKLNSSSDTKQTGRVLRSGQQLGTGPRHYLTTRLTTATARKLHNIINVRAPMYYGSEWYDVEDSRKYTPGISPARPYFYDSATTRTYWHMFHFHGIRNFFYLGLSNQEAGNLISYVAQNRGRGSLEIRRWVPFLDDDKTAYDGGWVLFDIGELQRQGRDMQRIIQDYSILRSFRHLS